MDTRRERSEKRMKENLTEEKQKIERDSVS